MRILSQGSYTEKYDIPYENVAITYSKYMEGRWRIYAQGSLFGINPNENFVQIAEYSTAEKAQKAMEMLRNVYYESELSKTNNDGTSFLTTHFQFPADSEIEV